MLLVGYWSRRWKFTRWSSRSEIGVNLFKVRYLIGKNFTGKNLRRQKFSSALSHQKFRHFLPTIFLPTKIFPFFVLFILLCDVLGFQETIESYRKKCTLLHPSYTYFGPPFAEMSYNDRPRLSVRPSIHVVLRIDSLDLIWFVFWEI